MTAPYVTVGFGLNPSATAEGLTDAVDVALEAAGSDWAHLVALATLDRLRTHRAIATLPVPVRYFTAEQLAAVVPVTTADAAVAGATSVAEAAALVAGGQTRGRGTLLVPKRCTATVCVAVAISASISGTISGGGR